MEPRILGVDYGKVRVGLAVSDPLGMFAIPLRTETVASQKQAVQAVLGAATEIQAVKIVVGLPLNMDGSHGEMAEWAERFAALLSEQLDIPVVMWDERLSSQLVERTLIAADMSREKRKAVRDKLAAQSILQSYMDSLA